MQRPSGGAELSVFQEPPVALLSGAQSRGQTVGVIPRQGWGGEHRRSIPEGAVSLVKELEFHPRVLTGHFHQRGDMMLSAFLESSSGCRKAKRKMEQREDGAPGVRPPRPPPPLGGRREGLPRQPGGEAWQC